MCRRREDRAQPERGQSTVEFALVLPLIVLCVAGIVWVGNLMTQQVRLEHAAREGARAAAVDTAAASNAAETAVRRSFGSTGVVRTTVEAEYVVVHVSTDVDGLPWIGVGSRTLHAEAHMRREDIND